MGYTEANPAYLTAVLSNDRQTGLPTLLRFCTDLQARLEQGTVLGLIVFCLDAGPRLVGTSRQDGQDSDVLAIVQLTLDALHSYSASQLYRIATDSFAIVLPDISRAPALQLAELLRMRIERLESGLLGTFAVAGAPQDAGEAGALLAVCEAQLLCNDLMRNRVYAATPVESLPPTTTRLVNVLISRMIALVEVGQQLLETEQQALHDPISGLPNSRSFSQTLPRYIERSARHSTPLALLIIDGDNLKTYNTCYGYHAGNAWIRRIAHTLTLNLRPGDYVARWFVGDEFVVLLPNTST